MQFDANLHEKTRAKIEEKLAAGFVFDAEKWKAGAEPKEAAPAASMALVARVAEATRALEVTVEMVAAKRVEAMGTLGRRGARSMLESTWRTCLAELTPRARIGVWRRP